MPLVSQTFDQLLDFTRTSAATFVGSNGLIQTTPASANLLTWTQQFDNAAWFKTAATVSANTTVAPDGTSTADKIVATAVAGFHGASINANVTSGVSYTLTFYVKAAEYSKVYIADGQSGGYNCTFDLAAGTAGTPGGVYTGKSASITSVGNGWYRCALSFTATVTQASGPSVAGYPDTGATFNNFGVQYTGDATSGVFAWGAQLEAASTATTYTRNNGGVFPPRFDYDPVTLAAKGLLIEEQRANLVTYSDQFDNAAWVKNNSTVTANATTSPDGTTNADLITPTTTGGVAHSTYNSVTVSATSYSLFFYAKQSGYTGVRVANTTTGAGADFDLANGVVFGTPSAGFTASIQSAGNGWYRCSITFTATAGANIYGVYVQQTPGTTVYAGNGTSGVFLWGAQLEAGAFATSYIPTVASQVTRTADQCSIVAPNFAPWYNQSEGTFVAEFGGNGSYALAVNNATDSNFTGIAYVDPTNVRGITETGGVYNYVQMASGAAGSVNKTAYAYKTNDLAGSTNGGAVSTDVTAVIPTVSRMFIGTFGGFGFLNGHIRSIRYYPTRLTNAQLQALTA